MSAQAYVTSCQKHVIAHRVWGGSSKLRCPECERDQQLARIEEKLDQLLSRPRPDPRLAFIG